MSARTTDTTLGGLLALTIKPAGRAIARWIECRMLRAERQAESINSSYFEKQRDNGMRGFNDSQKRIMLINTRLRELER